MSILQHQINRYHVQDSTYVAYSSSHHNIVGGLESKAQGPHRDYRTCWPIEDDPAFRSSRFDSKQTSDIENGSPYLIQSPISDDLAVRTKTMAAGFVCSYEI